VKLEETISSFERLVAGEFDQLPEQAFFDSEERKANFAQFWVVACPK
jgi:F0F1-type ATP synthase beta subunit